MKTTLLAFFLIAAAPFANAFPDKPIRIIVPTEAGGGHDTIARIFQRAIQEKKLLSEKLVIVNIPGAGGAVGTRKIKDSPNDGYTIGIWNPNALISAKLMGITRYDHNDYEVIGMTGFTNLGMGVKTDSAINSVTSMIERGKVQRGAIKLATEIGTAAHIIPIILAHKAGFEFRVVASGGGSKRLASILGGHTDISLFSTSALINFRESGLSPLMLFSEERSPLLPDTPTAKENGIELSITESRIWLAPKGTPEERLAVIRKALESAIQDESVMTRLTTLGMTPEFGDSKTVLADIEKMRALAEPIIAQLKR
ncbi:MAG: tripartite tricarboxylate transporter substrate binding protein [Opitutaceae bacterium]|nr:tripartite tricarboxylate transporter substrate binding protein [Opitutaceae bacterium]